MRGKFKVHKNRLTPYARGLKKSYTNSERLLWSRLRSKQLLGFKFRRQYPYMSFILDFYCPKLNLVIEIDGSSHDENKYEYDCYRDEVLRKAGMHLLRFTEYEVKANIDNVLQTIVNFCDEQHI